MVSRIDLLDNIVVLLYWFRQDLLSSLEFNFYNNIMYYKDTTLRWECYHRLSYERKKIITWYEVKGHKKNLWIW